MSNFLKNLKIFVWFQDFCYQSSKCSPKLRTDFVLVFNTFINCLRVKDQLLVKGQTVSSVSEKLLESSVRDINE